MKIDFRDNLNPNYYQDRALVAFEAHKEKKNWQKRKMETAIGFENGNVMGKFIVAEWVPNTDLIIVRIFT